MSNHHLRQSLLMLLKYPLAGAVGRVFSAAAPLCLLLGRLHAPLLCLCPGGLRLTLRSADLARSPLRAINAASLGPPRSISWNHYGEDSVAFNNVGP